ncbi:MAG: DUF4142 domain-containing protein [Verrucomicrobiales bacterium]|nr:DUF4142 domain-containing protein [Verrucomicrobiales bacterium]MCP5558449.1 DUF4142 domain-containing protein [Verrucomicrobiaceae bacterium]
MKIKTHTLSITSTLALCAALFLAPHAMAESKATLDSADVTFVKHEVAAGTSAEKMAALGAEKSESAEVKAFAKMLVTDHTQANTELTALAVTKGVELSTDVDAKHVSKFEKLEKVSGAEFDKEFLAVIISGHKKCISNFETSAKDATDSDVKMWSAKMLPILKAHLVTATELAAK